MIRIINEKYDYYNQNSILIAMSCDKFYSLFYPDIFKSDVLYIVDTDKNYSFDNNLSFIEINVIDKFDLYKLEDIKRLCKVEMYKFGKTFDNTVIINRLIELISYSKTDKIYKYLCSILKEVITNNKNIEIHEEVFLLISIYKSLIEKNVDKNRIEIPIKIILEFINNPLYERKVLSSCVIYKYYEMIFFMLPVLNNYNMLLKILIDKSFIHEKDDLLLKEIFNKYKDKINPFNELLTLFLTIHGENYTYEIFRRFLERFIPKNREWTEWITEIILGEKDVIYV